jgi:hypothetical protein
MKTTTRALSRQPHPTKNGTATAAANGARPRPAAAGKPAKAWRFAPDAIGMMSGPRDLSLREGLSA